MRDFRSYQQVQTMLVVKHVLLGCKPTTRGSYLLKASEILYDLASKSDNTENYHRSNNKRLFNNSKYILYYSNWI